MAELSLFSVLMILLSFISLPFFLTFLFDLVSDEIFLKILIVLAIFIFNIIMGTLICEYLLQKLKINKLLNYLLTLILTILLTYVVVYYLQYLYTSKVSALVLLLCICTGSTVKLDHVNQKPVHHFLMIFFWISITFVLYINITIYSFFK